MPICRAIETLLESDLEGVDQPLLQGTVVRLLRIAAQLRCALCSWLMCDTLAVVASRLGCPAIDEALIQAVQAAHMNQVGGSVSHSMPYVIYVTVCHICHSISR